MRTVFGCLLVICTTPSNRAFVSVRQPVSRSDLSVNAIFGSDDDVVAAARARSELRARRRAETLARAKQERVAAREKAKALREQAKSSKDISTNQTDQQQTPETQLRARRGEDKDSKEPMLESAQSSVSPLQARTFEFLKKRGVVGKNARRRSSGSSSGGGGEGGRTGRTESEDYTFAKERGKEVADVLKTAITEFGEAEREEKRTLKLKALANPSTGLTAPERARLKALVAANQEQREKELRKKGPVMIKTRLAFSPPDVTGVVDNFREPFPTTSSGAKWVLSTDASLNNLRTRGSSLSGSKKQEDDDVLPRSGGSSSARFFRTSLPWRQPHDLELRQQPPLSEGDSDHTTSSSTSSSPLSPKPSSSPQLTSLSRPCNVLLGRVSTQRCGGGEEEKVGGGEEEDGTSSTTKKVGSREGEEECALSARSELGRGGGGTSSGGDGSQYCFVQMSVALSNQLPEGSGVIDCSRFDGVELDVFCPRGESYNLHLRTEACVEPFTAYRATFNTMARCFTTVQVPWSEFVGHGRGAEGVPLDVSRLKRLGLLGFGRDLDCELAVAGVRFFTAQDHGGGDHSSDDIDSNA